jgi:hypothetical protein
MLMAEAHEWFSWQIHMTDSYARIVLQILTAGYHDSQILVTDFSLQFSWQILWQIENPHDKILSLNGPIDSCQSCKLL